MKRTDPEKLIHNKNTNYKNQETWINQLDPRNYSELEKKYMKQYDACRAFDRIANRTEYKNIKKNPEYQEINSNHANELDRLVHEQTKHILKKNRRNNKKGSE